MPRVMYGRLGGEWRPRCLLSKQTLVYQRRLLLLVTSD